MLSGGRVGFVTFWLVGVELSGSGGGASRGMALGVESPARRLTSSRASRSGFGAPFSKGAGGVARVPCTCPLACGGHPEVSCSPLVQDLWLLVVLLHHFFSVFFFFPPFLLNFQPSSFVADSESRRESRKLNLKLITL